MGALSLDLRKRIVAACERGGRTQQEVADLYDVSLGVVKKLLQQWRESGDLSPGYGRCGGKRKILAEHEEKLRDLLESRPDMTLEELRDGLGLDCTIQAVHYALLRMGLTYKKRRSEPANRTAKT